MQHHLAGPQLKQRLSPGEVPDQESDDGNNQSGDDAENDADDHDVTRPGKRKRPTSVSCELCKQRKVKCDRGQPSCGWCSRNGARCEYKERKKPGLRAGYGRELEQRLDKMEDILRRHGEILQAAIASGVTQNITPNASSVRNSNPSLPSDHGTPIEASPVYRPSADTTTTAAPSSSNARQASPFLPKASIYPPQNSFSNFVIAQPVPRRDGFPTHSHVADSAVSQTLPTSILPSPTTTSADYYANPHAQPVPSSAQVHSVSMQPLPEQDLPPYDLLYSLVDLYFKHVNTWCPILHRKATLDSLFGRSPLDETDRILLHAIVATTLRFSNDQRLTDESRKHHYMLSKQRVLLYGMENSTVKSLQALVILALDLCGSSNGPPGWNIMALITRSVVQLGLAVETTSLSVSPAYASIYTLRAMILPEPKDFIEEESRRRLFWMVYLLDRYATIATAFEFALDDRDIDRTLPCRDDVWMKNQKVETRWFTTQETPDGTQVYADSAKIENHGAFAYYIEILGILSKIHKFLKQPVDISAPADVERWQIRYKQLDTMLSSWKFGLPEEYGNTTKLFGPAGKTLNCAWIMLQATYHTAVVRLHSSAAYPTTRSHIFTPSYSASQRCHDAVETIATLAEFVVNQNMLNKLGPPFAFTLWVAARLLLVHGSTVERILSPKIGYFVNILAQIGRFWPVASRYRDLLQRVLDEHSDSEQQGDGVTPSSVRILADMRRTAFDLDFLISHQPRHSTAVPPLLQSVTPAARTPAPNELEYLDVFEFFNVPRLPVGNEHLLASTMASGLAGAAATTGSPQHGDLTTAGPNAVVVVPSNEFNITNFMVDANSDWLFPGR